jgi:DMSO reductase anchor subunit
MRPAFSVIFLTTLIGAAQGLFLALFAAEVLRGDVPRDLVVRGSIAVVVLAAAGLAASFFHLGRPERAWRSAAMWRTSWLSREVIALPAFMALAAAYGFAQAQEWPGALVVGAAAAAACLALFTCTAMIYASIRFLQEWASPFTLVNFVLMGCASGLTLAGPLAADFDPGLARTYSGWAIVATLIAFFVRAASLVRNARIVPRSTTQSAIGARSPQVQQKSQGFTGGSFNTREFFHGVGPAGMRAVPWIFILLAFVVPVLLLAAGRGYSETLMTWAFILQYTGLLVERWYFLADARHPQNLYYQSVA